MIYPLGKLYRYLKSPLSSDFDFPLLFSHTGNHLTLLHPRKKERKKQQLNYKIIISFIDSDVVERANDKP